KNQIVIGVIRMKAILRPFINKQVRAFAKHTEAVPVEITSDWVHKLRLILKRQRTAFHLMEWLSPDEINSKKLWKPYKDLHERSGAFRDLCVLEEFFQAKQESFPASTPFILNYLKEQKEIHHLRVFEALKSFESPDKKSLKKAYKALDEHKKNKIVMALINQYSHEIISTVSRALITKYVSDETYHEIRRLLKMLYFTLRFIRKEDYKDRLLVHPKWCKLITDRKS